jgi:hypothetical protein
MDISKIINERTNKSIKSIVSIPAWRIEKEVLQRERRADRSANGSKSDR